MKKLLLIVAIAIAATPIAHGIAHAQPADPTAAGKVPLARRLYEEGVDAVNKGRWSVAYERFKASYELAPRVLTLFNLGGAQAQTGRLVEATESYRRFLRETTDGRYPDLRSDATTQLDQLEKQIAQLTIEVTNIDAGDVIAIDDSDFPRAAIGEPIPVNPGTHVAKVQRAGAVVANRSITLAPGAAEVVRLELPVKQADLVVRKPPESSVVTSPGSDIQPVDKPKSRSVLRSPWLWSAVAVVVIGGAAGAYYFTRPNDEVLVVR
jgi:hypothetical protein